MTSSWYPLTCAFLQQRTFEILIDEDRRVHERVHRFEGFDEKERDYFLIVDEFDDNNFEGTCSVQAANTIFRLLLATGFKLDLKRYYSCSNRKDLIHLWLRNYTDVKELDRHRSLFVNGYARCLKIALLQIGWHNIQDASQKFMLTPNLAFAQWLTTYSARFIFNRTNLFHPGIFYSLILWNREQNIILSVNLLMFFALRCKLRNGRMLRIGVIYDALNFVKRFYICRPLCFRIDFIGRLILHSSFETLQWFTQTFELDFPKEGYRRAELFKLAVINRAGVKRIRFLYDLFVGNDDAARSTIEVDKCFNSLLVHGDLPSLKWFCSLFPRDHPGFRLRLSTVRMLLSSGFANVLKWLLCTHRLSVSGLRRALHVPRATLVRNRWSPHVSVVQFLSKKYPSLLIQFENRVQAKMKVAQAESGFHKYYQCVW